MYIKKVTMKFWQGSGIHLARLACWPSVLTHALSLPPISSTLTALQLPVSSTTTFAKDRFVYRTPHESLYPSISHGRQVLRQNGQVQRRHAATRQARLHGLLYRATKDCKSSSTFASATKILAANIFLFLFSPACIIFCLLGQR